MKKMNKPKIRKHEEVCVGQHTPCPGGYMDWHSWAEKMSKTHKQIQCSQCNLWAIWVKKEGRKR